MHRDQKIGLSLAVLIIGFTGAFCFRNEPLNDPHPLAMEQVAALDTRIEHLPVRAYTQREGVGGGINEPGLLSTANEIVDVSHIETPIAPMAMDEKPTGDVVELFTSPPEPLSTSRRPTEKPFSSTEPVPLVLPEAASQEHPHSEIQVALATPPADVDGPSASLVVSEGEDRTYVVRSGDTLSGVSVQMYGTVRRYLDIYRANRDTLSDPNDLPVGTTLRIP